MFSETLGNRFSEHRCTDLSQSYSYGCIKLEQGVFGLYFVFDFCVTGGGVWSIIATVIWRKSAVGYSNIG